MRKKCCHNPWTLRPSGTNDLTETERRTKTESDAETICSPRGDKPWTTTHRGRLPPDSASLQRRASNRRVASSLGRFRFWVWKDETKNAENLWKTLKQTRCAWSDNMFWMQLFFSTIDRSTRYETSRASSKVCPFEQSCDDHCTRMTGSGHLSGVSD